MNWCEHITFKDRSFLFPDTSGFRFHRSNYDLTINDWNLCPICGAKRPGVEKGPVQTMMEVEARFAEKPEPSKAEPDPLTCQHANEAPRNCLCDAGCYCKENTCKEKPSQEGREVVPETWNQCPHGSSRKIIDPCPSCGAQSLFIGMGGYLTCSVIGCKEPGVTAAIKDALKAAAQTEREECARVAETFCFDRFYDCENCGEQRITHRGCKEIAQAIRQARGERG